VFKRKCICFQLKYDYCCQLKWMNCRLLFLLLTFSLLCFYRMMKSTNTVSSLRNSRNRWWIRRRFASVFCRIVELELTCAIVFLFARFHFGTLRLYSCWRRPGATMRRSRRSCAACRRRMSWPRRRWKRCCRPWRSWPSTTTRRVKKLRTKQRSLRLSVRSWTRSL